LRLLWLVLKGEHVRSIGRFHDSSSGDNDGYYFGSGITTEGVYGMGDGEEGIGKNKEKENVKVE